MQETHAHVLSNEKIQERKYKTEYEETQLSHAIRTLKARRTRKKAKKQERTEIPKENKNTRKNKTLSNFYTGRKLVIISILLDYVNDNRF